MIKKHTATKRVHITAVENGYTLINDNGKTLVYTDSSQMFNDFFGSFRGMIESMSSGESVHITVECVDDRDITRPASSYPPSAGNYKVTLDDGEHKTAYFNGISWINFAGRIVYWESL